MKPALQSIYDLVQDAASLSEADKKSLIQSIKETEKLQAMLEFKLERIETDKKTLAIMLDESIEDLQKKSLAIEQTNLALTKTLKDLKEAQAQLIQREKMASLGELTAGIAHEIQNPLNFVNNFSEVSIELADELKEILKNSDLDPQIVSKLQEIVLDLVQIQEKINIHGKRADAIVKAMLQHSHLSSGQKELTDINSLADEYLRLSYHGMRAKDKSFNADVKTDFDQSLGKISIIPQDIGRVLLNLINNAFYSIIIKKKQQLDGYEPIIAISTKVFISSSGARGVEIKVKDNGIGIPEKILDKIYQPFFTTKPAGEGTGLGLSLSYDIITKEHGGELKVETKEGEFAEFIVTLPV